MRIDVEPIDYNDLIDVIYFCMPDGSNHWMKKDDPRASTFFIQWKNENSEFKGTDCVAVIANVKMPRFYVEQFDL